MTSIFENYETKEICSSTFLIQLRHLPVTSGIPSSISGWVERKNIFVQVLSEYCQQNIFWFMSILCYREFGVIIYMNLVANNSFVYIKFLFIKIIKRSIKINCISGKCQSKESDTVELISFYCTNFLQIEVFHQKYRFYFPQIS